MIAELLLSFCEVENQHVGVCQTSWQTAATDIVFYSCLINDHLKIPAAEVYESSERLVGFTNGDKFMHFWSVVGEIQNDTRQVPYFVSASASKSVLDTLEPALYNVSQLFLVKFQRLKNFRLLWKRMRPTWELVRLKSPLETTWNSVKPNKCLNLYHQ